MRRQEREWQFCERKEYEINKRLNEDIRWISEQALLHHMDQQGRRLYASEPGQLPQGHSTKQHAHQDPVTALTLEPVNNNSMPMTDGGMPTQEIPGQNLLQLENHGRPQEVDDERDEEEQVASLLELQEPRKVDTKEAGPEAMEQDAGDLDSVENGLTALVGPEDSERSSTQGPDPVDPLDDGRPCHYKQASVPTPDSRRNASVSEGQSTHEPKSHTVSGQGVPEPVFQDPAYETLECHEPDCASLWGDGPVVNDGQSPRSGEAPTRSTHCDTGVASQAQEPVATRPSSPGGRSEQLEREDEDMDLEGQNEPGGVTGMSTNEPVSQSQQDPELADISNLSPEHQVWVSSQVQNARERARNSVGPHFL